MAIQQFSHRVSPEQEGKRLDQVLAEWLPQALKQPVSKAQARKLIQAGAVYLNRKRTRIASKPLRTGARLDVHLDRARWQEPESTKTAKFRLTSGNVLFEDEWLIAFDKPPGLPTQPTLDEARANLYALAKKFLADRSQAAGEGTPPYLGLHHRLDRDTSGVVLFTKKVEANSGVAELFREHGAKKTYLALTRRPAELPPKQWQVSNFLGKARGTSKPTRYTAVRSGGSPAITDFQLLETAADALLIEARPKTGRTHQIRVHLSERGMPILGDFLYGETSKTGSKPATPHESRRVSRPESHVNRPAVRMMLHAANLSFKHPMTHSEVSISSPVPEDFRSCLQQLKPSGGSADSSG